MNEGTGKIYKPVQRINVHAIRDLKKKKGRGMLGRKRQGRENGMKLLLRF